MILIHVGLRKAGSSTLQFFLKKNAERLRSLGFDYVNIGHWHGKSHLNLVYEVRGDSAFQEQFGTLEQVADYWATHKQKTLIISSEIFESCRSIEARKLRRALRTADNDFHILLYIRDVLELVQSSYSQQVKEGRLTSNFDDFFARWVQRKRADYFVAAENWARVYGWNKLIIRVLDKASLVNGDLIEDFLSVLGATEGGEGERAPAPPIAAVNVSPGWRVIEALRTFHAGDHGLPADHDLLKLAAGDRNDLILMRRAAEVTGDQLGWNDDRGRYLTAEQAERCHEIYADVVRRLNAHLAEPLPRPKTPAERGFTPREFLPSSDQLAVGDLRAFYDGAAEWANERKAARSGRPIA